MGKRGKSKFQAAVEVGLVRFLIWLIDLLPYRTAQRFGGNLGVFAHNLLKVRVEHAKRELLTCFPDKTEEWAAKTVREVYRHFGTLAVEQALMAKLEPVIEKYVHIDDAGLVLLKELQDRGKGTFVVSGHYGNWELPMTRTVKLGVKLSGVSGHQANEGIDKLLDDNRSKAGVQMIKRGEAGKGVLKALRNNHAIAVMLDQDAGTHGVFVPFFGRLASTTRIIASLSRRLDPSVIVMETWRDDVGDIQVRFHPIEVPRTDDEERDIYEMTATLTAKIEEIVRKRPEQWLWLHRRWKTRPPEEQKGDS